MNELRYEQYNKCVMKDLNKNVSMSTEPKWVDPQEYNKKEFDKFSRKWTPTTSPIEQPDALRPEHYGGADSTYEVFKVLEAWNLDKDFYLGNVIKYVARAGKKNSAKEKEDLQKALVYLQRRIDSL